METVTETEDAPPPSSVDRQVMARILKKVDLTDEARAEVEASDAYLDEALGAVDEEEPTLLRWLMEDPELRQLCWANRSTMYWMILRDARRKVPLDKTVSNIDKLIGRMLAATAWRATMRAREGSR